MEKKFSPAPWTYKSDISPTSEDFIFDAKGMYVCVLEVNPGFTSVYNAHLIETAPILLEALEEVNNKIGNFDKMPAYLEEIRISLPIDTILKIQAAISKAYGKP